MFTSFKVFLDACVLVPNWLRDILLTAAEGELYRPLWSETVLDEMERALVNKRNLTSERARYTRQMMETAFPDAAVSGYEGLSPSMPINAKDQHVLAAALVGHAQLLVTDNSKDFPASILSTFRINVQTADEFLMDLLARYPDEILASLQFMAENTGKAGKPELTLYDCVRLIGATAPNFAGGASSDSISPSVLICGIAASAVPVEAASVVYGCVSEPRTLAESMRNSSSPSSLISATRASRAYTAPRSYATRSIQRRMSSREKEI